MTVNRLSVSLMVLTLLVIGGCLILPVGHKTTGQDIRDADLAFIELGVTTKSQIVERLGEIFASFEEHNVIAYFWFTKTEFIWVVIGAGAAGAGHVGSYRQNYAVYIQFDSNEKVKRFQRMQVPDKGLSVEEWLTRE
jgi:hypothetical protein